MRYGDWAMAVLLSVALAACGSGGSGFGPPPGGGSGTKATATVTVLNTFENPRPLSNVHVFAEDDPAPTPTGPDGRATVSVPTGQAARLFLQFPAGSQNIYPLTVPAGQPAIEVTLFAEPVAATTTTSGVMILPTPQVPAGTAGIIDPPDGTTIPCAPAPAVCHFDVHGHASTVLGQPGTPFLVYVALIPLSPAAEGTFLEFPPASVDPATGLWHVEAHIGGTGMAAPQPGERVQIVALVTSVLVIPDTLTTSVLFPSPGDIPGVVYISRVITLQVGPR